MFSLIDFGEHTDLYPNDKPISSKVLKFNGRSAYDIHYTYKWKEDEFTFLKQVCAYHLSAPCYKGKYATLANKFERVKVVDAFLYLVAVTLTNKVDIF